MDGHDKIFTDQIKNIVQQTDPTAVTILYGSRATGKAREDSDWDILILLDRPTVSIKDEQLFRENLYELSIETGEHISTFAYAKNEWNDRLSATPLYESVTKHGVIL